MIDSWKGITYSLWHLTADVTAVNRVAVCLDSLDVWITAVEGLCLWREQRAIPVDLHVSAISTKLSHIFTVLLTTFSKETVFYLAIYLAIATFVFHIHDSIVSTLYFYL